MGYLWCVQIHNQLQTESNQEKAMDRCLRSPRGKKKTLVQLITSELD